MSTKKDIGSVIKSAMEGYHSTPDDLWIHIESKLKRQRRIRMLLLLLLLLGITTAGVVYINTIDKNSVSSEKTNKVTSDPDLNSNPTSIDSISKKNTDEVVKEPENGTNLKELDTNSKLKLTQTKESKSPTKKTIVKNDKNNYVKGIQKNKNLYRSLLSMVEVHRSDPLELSIDSLQLFKGPTLDENQEEFIEESIWRFSPFVSLDHYNTFGRSTSQQNTLNYGAYLYFYGSQNLALRIGFKKAGLQYNFEGTTSRQQQVSYSEIPIEGRYFFNSKNAFKTSFRVGGSFMFLQNATLIDLDNNTSRDNRDIFTGSTFSFNTGIGLHYDISHKWRLNLESAFKYHITPYSRSQNFSPYNVSLSFGVEYGF